MQSGSIFHPRFSSLEAWFFLHQEGGALLLQQKPALSGNPFPRIMLSDAELVWQSVTGVKDQPNCTGPSLGSLNQSSKRRITWLEAYAATVCPSALPRRQDTLK